MRPPPLALLLLRCAAASVAAVDRDALPHRLAVENMTATELAVEAIVKEKVLHDVWDLRLGVYDERYVDDSTDPARVAVSTCSDDDL